jgi:hypothetical protein
VVLSFRFKSWNEKKLQNMREKRNKLEELNGEESGEQRMKGSI